MTKIMLVEDDNNLREIYQARLAAEGYDIVAAEDGEAALAIAAKERPNLIITDVMMPKISGFEMLDILRNTDALHDVKVIMLTALSQAEDNARAGKLGADRYLVKSQVTLEDIVKAAHELLDSTPVDAASPAEASSEPAIPDAPEPAVVEAPGPTPITVVEPLASPPQANFEMPDPGLAESAVESVETQTSKQEESALHEQINQFLTQADSEPAPAFDSTALDSDAGATSIDLSSNMESQNLVSTAPTDESEDEYARDDATPDMGNLSVQSELSAASAVSPQPDINPAPTAPEPVNIVRPIEEPAPAPSTFDTPQAELPVPAAPVVPAMELPAPVEPQTGDQVVSSAIDSMMAQSPATVAEPVLPPSQAWKQQDQPAVAPQPVPEPTAMAAQEEPETPVDSDPEDLAATTPRPIGPPPQEGPSPDAPSADAQSTRTVKKIISPLSTTAKPDIHQLLALEEAKNGALLASQAGTTPPPAASNPQPVTQPVPQPVQQPVPPEINSNSGLDPNTVAL